MMLPMLNYANQDEASTLNTTTTTDEGNKIEIIINLKVNQMIFVWIARNVKLCMLDFVMKLRFSLCALLEINFYCYKVNKVNKMTLNFENIYGIDWRGTVGLI